MKIKKIIGGGRFGGGGGVRLGGGCERRIEVFVKIPKKKKLGGGSGGGVRLGGVGVDVNGELKFLGKFTHKKNFLGGGGGAG